MQNKKQRDTAAADAEMQRQKEDAGAKGDGTAPDRAGNADILGEEDDKDVIF